MAAEQIESMSALEMEFKDDASQGQDLYSLMVNLPGTDWRDEKDRHLNDLRRRIKWRRSRQSPPKCLECGSTDLLVIPETDEENENQSPQGIEHPGCNGLLQVRGIGFSQNRAWIIYTSEGKKLRCE
ncbi:MAG: hypothetical protein ACKVP0_24490 [Pirellulaceae bacterium]